MKPTDTTIMVIEDEIGARATLCAILEDAGYRVIGLGRGTDALRMIRTNSFDVVITDMQMPLMGGMELLERIAQIKADTVTILLTGSTISKSECSQKPFAHLCKPFSHNQLIEVIQEGLKNHTALAHG